MPAANLNDRISRLLSEIEQRSDSTELAPLCGALALLRDDLHKRDAAPPDGQIRPTHTTIAGHGGLNQAELLNRRQVEHDLQRSRDQMEIVVREANVGVWYCPLPFDKLIWDAKVKEHFHLPADAEVTIETFYNGLHPDDRERTRQSIDASILQRLPYDIDYRTISADGKNIKWIRASGRGFYDESGNPTRFDGITIDVTQQHTAREQAETANRAKDHFLAVLSHELRTPLTPVLATAQMLEADQALSSAHREMIRMIRRNVELEARLIDDLLDSTRISHKKLQLHRVTANVHEKIEYVIEMCRPDATAKMLSIETDYSAKDFHVSADPARLQQIFWNLLKNAVKFTPPSGQVRIATQNPSAGKIAVTFTDSGTGIDPEALARIFNAFEQGSREVTQSFGGLGLGLTISKALVELHGGRINAVSDGKGKGAAFTIELPTETKSAGIPHSTPPVLPDHLQCAVLLVEDHEDTRRVMTRLLAGMGCEVMPAATVAEALDIAARHRFDAVISDVGLPDVRGTELMRQLKSLYNLRGIALSGYGMDEDLAKSLEAGFEAHLIKPVNLDVLEDALRKIVPRRCQPAQIDASPQSR